MYDIIIVGAGPAGLTAAIYAARANKKVLVFEANIHGGQIVNAYKIENYPGLPNVAGYDFANILYNQVKDLGVEIKYETVIGIDENKNIITKSGKYQAKAIILATGASKRKLNIESEERFIGKGVSYCATCDGNFYKGKTVAIVGGGNTALEDAVYLSNLAKKVYIIHRRDVFTGDNKYLNELKERKNVEFILNSNVVSLQGEKLLENIDVKNNDGNVNNLEVNGLFIAIGQAPRNEIFKNTLKLDEFGYIYSEDGVHTSVNRIYVAGDARNKELRQLTTAVSDGSIASTVAIKEMEED